MTMLAATTPRSLTLRTGGAILLAAVAAAMGTGCASHIPVEEFERFDGSIRQLRVIASDSDTELEELAFAALVAESRGKPRLRRAELNPGRRWSDLWMLVDARHASLTFLSDYLDLLLHWSDLASERVLGSMGRVVFGGRSEESTISSAIGHMRFSADRLDEAIAKIEPLLDIGVSPAAKGVVEHSLESLDDVEQGAGRQADSAKLAHLIQNTNDEMGQVMDVTTEIEKRILKIIDAMATEILESYNAARPPAYRSDRLTYDAEAIRRMARANWLKRASKLVREASGRVKPALLELAQGTREGLSTEDLSELNHLVELIERGPQRVRGEPGAFEEQGFQQQQMQQMRMNDRRMWTK